MAGLLNLASGALGAIPGGQLPALGLSVAGQIFGAVKASKAAKESQQLLDKKQAENDAEYSKAANQSFLDTATAKDAVKSQKDAVQDAQKAIAGRGAITGASDEAIVASNTGVQKNYSDSVSRLAAAGTQFQDSQKRMYLARKDALDNQQMQINQQKSEGAANLMGNAGDLMTSVMGSAGMSDADKASGMSEVLKQRQSSGMGVELNKIAKSAFK